MHRFTRLLTIFPILGLAACASSPPGTRPADHAAATPAGLRGTLIPIGGGLSDDNSRVYQRFIALAAPRGSPAGPPRIVIVTAASGDEVSAALGKIESLRAYAPDAVIDSIGRTTPADVALPLIERASALFFTGGDQKRIIDKYRPAGADTPEAVAMRALLDRGGVIAGTSAGDAMMSNPMFLTGRSAEALGIRSTRSSRGEDDDPDESRSLPPLGPRIGPGMNFLPWAITDSHFFERHRFGRLVAACEASGKRLGLGISEDAAVEIDLATGTLTGLSDAPSLLVDVGSISRAGPAPDRLTRRGVRTRLIERTTRIVLPDLLNTPPPSFDALPQPPAPAVELTADDPRRRRELAAVFFTRAQAPGQSPLLLMLDGYSQLAWPDGSGGAIVELAPLAQPAPAD